MQGLPLLDQLIANAWPAAVEEVHGGWRFRYAHGVTRRANSALAVDSDGSVDELLDRAEAFYRERQAPTLFQVSTASVASGLAAQLHDRGYRSTALTMVQTASAGDVVESTQSSFEVQLTETPTEQWLRTYWSVEFSRGRTDADMKVVRDVLLVPPLPTVFAAVRDGTEVLGVGQLVIEGGWAGVQCMATPAAHRRRGVARTALQGLAREAVRRGVDRLYLAVLADNEGARTLYESAGFEPTHEYSYFAADQD